MTTFSIPKIRLHIAWVLFAVGAWDACLGERSSFRVERKRHGHLLMLSFDLGHMPTSAYRAHHWASCAAVKQRGVHV